MIAYHQLSPVEIKLIQDFRNLEENIHVLTKTGKLKENMFQFPRGESRSWEQTEGYCCPTLCPSRSRMNLKDDLDHLLICDQTQIDQWLKDFKKEFRVIIRKGSNFEYYESKAGNNMWVYPAINMKFSEAWGKRYLTDVTKVEVKL